MGARIFAIMLSPGIPESPVFLVSLEAVPRETGTGLYVLVSQVIRARLPPGLSSFCTGVLDC